MFTAVIKLQGEFYFRFRSAYHVTLSRGLYPRQGTTHNGHQRATWYCHHSAVGHRPLNSLCAGAYPVDIGEKLPLISSFYTRVAGGPPGHGRQGLRPTTVLPYSRPRRATVLRRLRSTTTPPGRQQHQLTAATLYYAPSTTIQ